MYAKEIESFLTKGGLIAWGIVPTLDVDALESTNPDKLLDIYEKEFTSVKKMRLANEISNYHIDDDYIDDVIDNLIDAAYDQYIIEEVMLP